MASVSVRFIGLCIHLTQTQSPGIAPARHRVVMMNNPPRRMRSHWIDAHEPALIRLDGTRSPLLGVTMTIEHHAGSSLRYGATWKHVPHLTPPHTPPAELNGDVAYDRQPPAAAYFDIDAGVLSACRHHKAIGTRLDLEITNETVLVMAPWEGDALETIPLSDGDTLYLTNVAPHNKDDKWDYLLNYDIVREPFPDPEPPPDVDPHPELPDCGPREFGGDITASCSNSNYP